MTASLVIVASSFQFNVPIQPVAPRFVEVVGREHLALLLQLPAGWADRALLNRHSRLFWRAATFLHIACATGADDVLPRGLPTQSARNNVVEGEVFFGTAILALKFVAQEHVEASESGKFALLHILPQRDHAGDFHIETG